MDLITLRKKLSSYESEKGYLKNVSDEVLFELLIAWENWTGSGTEFYRSLGFTQSQMASVIGKAKKLKREGHFGEGDFKQVKVNTPSFDPAQAGSNLAIEILWTNGQVIRFSQVDHLIDFLKKSA